MEISLLTRRPGIFNLDFPKELIKRILNKKTGPAAVLESLERGLSDLGVKYSVNNKIFDIVHVVYGVKTLEYAIKLKKKGKIKTLIVGPAIVVSPEDAGGIILDANIDEIVFPSDWTKDYYCSKYPELSNKIKIWPAGVSDPGEPDEKKEGVLIFYKNNDKLLEEIKSYLENRINYSVLEYGKFKQVDYYKLLSRTKYLIYLSNSESQGIALQEAWIRNVPSFVWNRGYWQSGESKWVDEKISAPYLNNQNGLFFKDMEDFINKFDLFITGDFEPRKYCLENLTDRKSAEILINIINKYAQ